MLPLNTMPAGWPWVIHPLEARAKAYIWWSERESNSHTMIFSHVRYHYATAPLWGRVGFEPTRGLRPPD